MRPRRWVILLFLAASGWIFEAAGARPWEGGDSGRRSPPHFEVVKGTVRKICRITGDRDRHLNRPVRNRTFSRYKIYGTDLGSSFEHGGRLWFLFGDTVPPNPRNPASCTDAIAFTGDTDPSDGLDLEFLAHPDGSFLAPEVPGVDLGDMNVPLDGISAGRSMYVWFSTGGMKRSVLARSDDEARSFTLVYEASRSFFVNISADLRPGIALPGLPGPPRDWVLLFGSGDYRRSDVYLAAVPAGKIEEKEALRFFAGSAEGGVPRWSLLESDALPVIDTEHPFDPAAAGCAGELSVHYSETARAWIALYNRDIASIVLRSASDPWGPWSEPVAVFDPLEDGGYGRFIHMSWNMVRRDSVNDPHRENEWGAPYGPYVIERFTTGGPEGFKLYFLLSTWNPYAVVLMEAEFRAARGAPEKKAPPKTAAGTAAGAVAALFRGLEDKKAAAVKALIDWDAIFQAFREGKGKHELEGKSEEEIAAFRTAFPDRVAASMIADFSKTDPVAAHFLAARRLWKESAGPEGATIVSTAKLSFRLRKNAKGVWKVIALPQGSL